MRAAGIFGPKAEATSGAEDLTETGNRARKSLAPRVRAKRAARECASEMDGRKEPWQRMEHGFEQRSVKTDFSICERLRSADCVDVFKGLI